VLILTAAENILLQFSVLNNNERLTINPENSLLMKNIQHIGSTNPLYNRFNRSNHMKKTLKQEISTGSLTGMYPVILDGGKTVIYINDKNKESEIRLKYAIKK
jgi:hypothetical protein